MHVGEDAAADCKGTAGNEAKDERGVASLAGVEGGGMIAHAAAVTQKGIVAISPAGYSESIPSTVSMGNT